MLEIDPTGRTVRVNVTINGQARELDVEPRETLAHVLRYRLDLTGTKIGCDAQVCGACTVLVDGDPVSSCTIFTFDVDGKSVTTIEGLGQGGQLHPLQEAFVKHAAFQCGYCTAGMIMCSAGLLRKVPNPSREDVTDWLDGNICRCTAYDGIIAAVLDAAQQSSPGGSHGTVPNEAAGKAASEEANANWDS